MTVPTAPSDITTCPHGRRAGITVCLYCRQEARIAARRRRTRMLVRVGGIVVGAGAVITVLVAALVAIAPWSRSNVPEAAELAPAPVPRTKATSTRADVSARPRVAQAFMPSVAEGLTDLGDSVFAERAGNEVIVRFDNSALRTRFDEKFERTVRSTLPRVFGSDARTALDAVQTGALIRGDLLRELPARGIELPVTADRSLMLYPVTRPGETGPLVIAYRVVPKQS